MSALRILVVDDDDLSRGVISALLAFRPDWKICGEAADASKAIAQVARLHPDIVLIDSDMPNVDGYEATRQIVRNDPGSRVIVLTNLADEKTARAVFESGALGFVLKANATHELPAAIQAVQRGGTLFTARFAEMILKSYLQPDRKADASSTVSLPERGREAVRRLTEELAMTLGHQFNRPKATRTTARYFTIAVIAVFADGIWWYVLNGEPQQPPPAVEQLLVSLHLKSQAARVYAGNPEARVWEDVHTALYYCAGDDSFGKTPRGRVSLQRDAQLDHYSPASGKSCD
jgi:DNA-binding NarL/FixJ family response regulator